MQALEKLIPEMVKAMKEHKDLLERQRTMFYSPEDDIAIFDEWLDLGAWFD